jgi:hypothetical protein
MLDQQVGENQPRFREVAPPVLASHAAGRPNWDRETNPTNAVRLEALHFAKVSVNC